MTISEYLESGEEPISDGSYGDGYRCSSYLKDGTYLPCVMIRKSNKYVDLACRRFEEEKSGKSKFRFKGNGYKELVKNFVAKGNCVNDYDIESVEPSPFAIPLSLLKQIEGETSMSWTGFALEMKDGRLFSFGSSFAFEFFNLPEDYSFSDVEKVHNHSYVNSEGIIVSIKNGVTSLREGYDPSTVFRERPYFVCYID